MGALSRLPLQALTRRPPLSPSFFLPLGSTAPQHPRFKATSAPSPSPHQHVPKIEMPASIMSSLPGPPSYPVIKALPYFLKAGGAKKLHVYLENLRRDFGWVTKMEIPSLTHPLLFHPDDIRQVYAADGKYPGTATEHVPIQRELYVRTNTISKTLSTAENEDWRRLRTAMQKHLLPPGVASSYLPLINPVSRDLSEHLPKYQDNLKDIIPRFTFEGVASVLFGKRLGAISRTASAEDEKYIQYALEFFPEIQVFTYEPYWKLFPTPGYKRFLMKHEFLHNRGFHYVEELSKKIAEEPELYSRALLSRLLASKELTLEEVAINIAGLFIAGVDTTSNTLIWLLIHLASHPEAQESLYRELNSVLKGGDYDETLLNQLPYMKACFRESARLDAVTNSIPRRLQKDVTVSTGHVFPAGSVVYVSPSTNFRDPEIFERPNDYLPERWLDEAKAKREAQGNTLADHPMFNTPFSFGARMCIGARFAGVEMNSMIARVVQDYRFELAPGQPPVNKIFGIFAEPEVMPKFRFTPRK